MGEDNDAMTTIQLSRKNVKRIKRCGIKGERYNEILSRVLDAYEKGARE